MSINIARYFIISNDSVTSRERNVTDNSGNNRRVLKGKDPANGAKKPCIRLAISITITIYFIVSNGKCNKSGDRKINRYWWEQSEGPIKG